MGDVSLVVYKYPVLLLVLPIICLCMGDVSLVVYKYPVLLLVLQWRFGFHNQTARIELHTAALIRTVVVFYSLRYK